MSTIPDSPMPRRAEWYQVMYNLAAQKAHLALLAGDEATYERGREAFTHARTLLMETATILSDDGAVFPPKLREFLKETVEPSAAVLLAGVMQFLNPTDREGDDPVTSRAALLKALDEGVWSKGLVEYVESRSALPYRVRYNLACYYSQRAEVDELEASLRKAWVQFRTALTTAPRIEAAALATWALRDPSLRLLRTTQQFTDLVALYRLPTFERDADLDEAESSSSDESPPSTAGA